MKITMIAAHDSQRLIGSENGIPWQLPRDQQHFRAHTADQAILLGRRTFDEMRGWFTTQRPFLLTRSPKNGSSHSPEGLAIFPSIEEAIAQAQAAGESELLVCGGAQIYALALPFADELLITEVHAQFSGNAYFPEYLPADWRELSHERFEADTENSHAMSFVHYRRR